MNLDKLRELARAATPGPWEIDDDGICASPSHEQKYGKYVLYADHEYDIGVKVKCDKPDAAYISAVSPDVILALIDRLEQAERDLDAALAVLSDPWMETPAVAFDTTNAKIVGTFGPPAEGVQKIVGVTQIYVDEFPKR